MKRVTALKASRQPLGILVTLVRASLDKFCIIHKTNNELDLLINESLLIFRDCPTLNFQSFSIPRSLF